ncbi:MAG: pseudouridine synthase [Acetivibrionales bacterium]|nr:pseudouridine synthase [Clostridiales bacterium]
MKGKRTVIRLQKYLADAGVSSRRKCEELISQGRVQVNGRIVTEPGTKVEGTEEIRVDGKKVEPAKRKIYILLNKPVGYISSVRDQFSRKTVIDLVSGIKERIYPVGRLDYDTSGLIILTNDGEFANMLMHPRHEAEKVYRAEVEGMLGADDINRLEKGIDIGGYVTAPASVRVIDKTKKRSVVEISIHEGKNRQVRRMFESIGHPVLKLKRTAIGGITVGTLEEGKWRYLTKTEVEDLKLKYSSNLSAE